VEVAHVRKLHVKVAAAGLGEHELMRELDLIVASLSIDTWRSTSLKQT
jgi:hypothetical protein